MKRTTQTLHNWILTPEVQQQLSKSKGLQTWDLRELHMGYKGLGRYSSYLQYATRKCKTVGCQVKADVTHSRYKSSPNNCQHRSRDLHESNCGLGKVLDGAESLQKLASVGQQSTCPW